MSKLDEKKVRALLSELKPTMTIYEASQAIGRSRTYLWGAFKGAYSLNTTDLHKLCDLLDVLPIEILLDENTEAMTQLKAEMDAVGLSRYAAVRELRVRKSYFYDWMRGKYPFPADKLAELKRLLAKRKEAKEAMQATPEVDAKPPIIEAEVVPPHEWNTKPAISSATGEVVTAQTSQPLIRLTSLATLAAHQSSTLISTLSAIVDEATSLKSTLNK